MLRCQRGYCVQMSDIEGVLVPIMTSTFSEPEVMWERGVSQSILVTFRNCNADRFEVLSGKIVCVCVFSLCQLPVHGCQT